MWTFLNYNFVLYTKSSLLTLSNTKFKMHITVLLVLCEHEYSEVSNIAKFCFLTNPCKIL